MEDVAMTLLKFRFIQKVALTSILLSSGEICAGEVTPIARDGDVYVSEVDATLEENASTISNSAPLRDSAAIFDSEFFQKSETCSQLSVQRCVSCCEDFFTAGTNAWEQCQVTCLQLDNVSSIEY
jgi:hypothetical protein